MSLEFFYCFFNRFLRSKIIFLKNLWAQKKPDCTNRCDYYYQTDELKLVSDRIKCSLFTITICLNILVTIKIRDYVIQNG